MRQTYELQGRKVTINDNGHRCYIRLDNGSYLHVKAHNNYASYTYYKSLQDLLDRANGSQYRSSDYVSALRNAVAYAIGYNESYAEYKDIIA